MFRLGKIREELYRRESSTGWRENEHIDWFNAYDAFLDESGFRSSFPTVDDLTVALGENMHYFHGRIVENARISNVIDAYNLNGWGSAATHTDMVDAYRNPTGDPSILKYYTQLLYVAVKLRDKVMPVGNAPVADIYIVNESDLKGKYTLELECEDPEGGIVFLKTYQVDIKGGEEFGQLLVEGAVLPEVTLHGYYRLNAKIVRKGDVACEGFDELFAVDCASGGTIPIKGAVIDDSGEINALLDEFRGIKYPAFTDQSPQMDIIVVGAHDFDSVRRSIYGRIMEQVLNGTTLVVLDQADLWAEQWDNIFGYQAVQYSGNRHTGSGGRLFVGRSDLLSDLPDSQSMNWEYQALYRGDVWGLDIGRAGIETVVALAVQNRKDILTAVARIPFGNGRIIVSTLDMMNNIGSDSPQSSIAKKLFLNMLETGE
ncbi:hypothetical protein ES708_09554 [subsurface metagenome]